ncbi:MAG TPA: hypothetical protein VFF69_14390 [Phycisphaerales bacterium]|nr:hypothetical protein [Phycisphaerales bacterium]
MHRTHITPHRPIGTPGPAPRGAWIGLAAVLLALAANAALGQCPLPLGTQKLTAPDATASDLFGTRSALDGDILMVSSPGDDGQRGSVHVYRRHQGGFVHEQKLTASDGGTGDRFGISIDLLGNVAILGADLDDSMGTDSGSAYVFEFNGSQWIERQKLVPNDGSANDRFGQSACILDAQRVLVSAPYDDGPPTDAGSVYEFRLVNGAWAQHEKVVPVLIAESGLFGSGIDAEGDTLVVGAPGWDQSGNDAGALLVFRHNGSAWQEMQTLFGSDTAAGDQFGLALEIEGEFIMTGAWVHDGSASDAGAAYVFRRRPDGNWEQFARLAPSDLEAGDGFGGVVALEGTTAVISSHRADDAGAEVGAAYHYQFDGDMWVQAAKFYPGDPTGSDGFGVEFALQHPHLVVGAYRHDDPADDAGAAYVFNLDPSPISISLHPADEAVPAGNSAIFTVAADGTPPFTYTWRYNGVAIGENSPFFAGVGTDTLTVSPALLGMDGTIDVIVGNLCSGDQRSDPAALTVFDPCPPDFNGDGRLDTRDVLSFLNAWTAGCN